MKPLKDTRLAKVELGVYGKNTLNGTPYADEFLPDLRGRRAISKYREMRDNSATIGAILYAVEQTLRDVKIKVKPSKRVTKEQGQKEVEFVESVLDDMDHTLDDHISEALSSLTYGFAAFEVVYKPRNNLRSKYPDGRIGVKKLASRAQWTINKFNVDSDTGEILGFHQDGAYGKQAPYIPINKAVYYRTTSLNNDPAGRSILRNAYQPYYYLNKLQSYEAIAIERELHGIPMGRMPADYLSVDASEDQVALREYFEGVLRDVKFNEQGFILLPSDQYMDDEGKPSGEHLMTFELVSSSGNRSIAIDPVVKRYQHDIARSVMAEFMMLGTTSGSYALSKSKTDLFLRSMESYINTIVDTLNKQLVEPLWRLNGLPWETMPYLEAGDVAPHDLSEMSSFLRNLNNADISVADQPSTVEALIHDIAELPFDKPLYESDLADRKAKDNAPQQTTPPADAQVNQQGGVQNAGTRK